MFTILRILFSTWWEEEYKRYLKNNLWWLVGTMK